MFLFLPLLVLQILSAEGLFYEYPKLKLQYSISDGGDAGEPLFLTPYIQSGKIEEAKKLARVSLPDLPDLQSYAGFFTVDETYNSNLYAWYFPAENPSSNATVVWLQGGPGGSSMYGLFDENGPIYVKDNKFHRREVYWSQNNNVLYIDNPVGSGFSFTDSPDGYSKNQTHIGQQLYKLMVQFYKLFPELLETKLVISGESYGGKYAPALAYTIHKENPNAKARGDPFLPLLGITIGNGWCDPINQLDYPEYLYQLGFIDREEREKSEKIKEETKDLIKNESWVEAQVSWEKLLINLRHFTMKVSLYNLAITDMDNELRCSFCDILAKEETRKAIHVGNRKFDFISTEVRENLSEDFMQSVTPWISELLEHYAILFYNGQHDIIVAYPLTINFIRNMKWPGKYKFETDFRNTLFYSEDMGGKTDQVGYFNEGGNLLAAIIRNAGHMVPADQPNWMLGLLNGWIQRVSKKNRPENVTGDNNILPHQVIFV